MVIYVSVMDGWIITGAGSGGVRAVGEQGRERQVRGPGQPARVQGRRAPGGDEARLRPGLRRGGHLRRRLPAGAGLPVPHRAFPPPQPRPRARPGALELRYVRTTSVYYCSYILYSTSFLLHVRLCMLSASSFFSSG